MSRKVFFSFHYDRDIMRVNQVRNSWVTKVDGQKGFFWDNSLWERTKRSGDIALKRMIDEGIRGTSVTAVLAGRETYSRRWVRYEILRSYYESNGLLCVRISDLTPPNGVPDLPGPNPLDQLFVRTDHQRRRVYCWELEDGTWREPRDIEHWQSFDRFRYTPNANLNHKFSALFKTYYWSQNGYTQFDNWVEVAAGQVSR